MASVKPSQVFKCSLCLELFQKPKILPCFHTYCEQCLVTLASKYKRNQFPCPACRRIIQVPQGGVSAFQTNFYIDTEEMERARKDRACSAHPSNDVVSFCTSCDKAICVVCMLGEHKPHEIQTITDAAMSAKAQLATDKLQLQGIVDTMKGLEVKAEKNRSTFKRQAEEVKCELQERCAQLVSLAEEYRDTQLATLDCLTDALDSSKKDAEMMVSLKKKWTKLSEEQQEIQQVLDSGQDLQITLLARDLRLKYGCQDGFQALLPDGWPPKVLDVPSVQRDELNTSDSLSKVISAAIGSVATRKLLPLHISEVAQCSNGGIYFIAIFENGDFCVSFEQNDLPVQKFSSQGKLIDTVREVTGKVTMQSLASGECLYVAASPGHKHTHLAKSDRQFVFEQSPSMQGIVKKVDIKSTQTLTSEWVPMFTLSCTTSLVFDTNDSGTKVAIVESSQGDERTSILKIYQCPNPEPLYSVSLEAYTVSDICFCKIDGQDVLLMLDETYHGILLFDTEKRCLCKHRVESPLLVQPMALNTDKTGRIWIGCRDGKIFVCD